MKGISVSEGIALGKALVIEEKTINVNKSAAADCEAEKKLFRRALSAVTADIEDDMNTLAAKDNGQDSDEYMLMEAHLMMASDEEVIERIERLIENEKISASWAVDRVFEEYGAMFEKMEDEYLRARSADCADIRNRILESIQEGGARKIRKSSEGDENIILVAKELLPSDMLSLDKSLISGIITEKGSRTSHISILARNMNIPAIIGADVVGSRVKNGDDVIIYGDTGEFTVRPSKEEIDDCILKIREQEEHVNSLKEYIGKPAETLNGKKVTLLANIGTPDEIQNAADNDAEGIGLFRTEFLFMDRNDMPSEDEQYEAYKKVSEFFQGREVIIRTLDAGGDKNIEYLNIPAESNPFLGYRAIRLCLGRPELFKIQLRALLRANTTGNIKIMIPMICNADELKATRKLLQEAEDELRAEGKQTASARETKVGIMVETPAAAVISDELAKDADFFSIGTNDLIQYTLASDRMNQNVAYLYDISHPAILRLIKMTVESAHKAGIPVGMCGEAGSDPEMIKFLLKNGIDEISMSPGNILKAKSIIRNMSI